MLSDTSLPVIQATLPVVGEHIEEIAKRFYKHMFEAQPDLLDGLFNRGNQADGRQQQALAGSIAAFAGMLVEQRGPGAGPSALPGGPQTRLAGAKPGPVPDCPRPPDVGDRGCSGGRRHSRGRRRLGRGLLADGEHAHQQGARAVQRGAPHPRDDLADVAGGASGSRRRTTSSVRRRTDRRAGGQAVPARAVRHHQDDHARRRAPAPAVQPDQGRRRAAPAVRGQAGPRTRDSRRRDVQSAAQRGPGGRRGGALGSLRRRGAGVHGPAPGPGQRGDRHHPMAGMLSHLVQVRLPAPGDAAACR